MNKEELKKKLKNIKKEIELFISKYDSIYTLFYVSQNRCEDPIVNFLFNLCLKDKNNSKLYQFCLSFSVFVVGLNKGS